MRKSLFLATLILTLNYGPASAGSIVIGGPADMANAFPFGGAVGGAGTRYQQSYSSSDFTGPISIVGIDFLGGAGTLATSTYTLYLSTITKGIDTLSNSDFDSNLGANNTLFASRDLSGAAPQTLSFNGVPFLYDPASGNLLLDIAISPGGVSANGSGGGTYEKRDGTAIGIFSRYQNFGDGTLGSGLVTQFDFSLAAVPEPSTFGFCFALTSAALYVTRKRHQSTVLASGRT